MDLKVKNIGLPQHWGDGATTAVDLYMLDNGRSTGTMFVTFESHENVQDMTVEEIERAAIAKAKKILGSAD